MTYKCIETFNDKWLIENVFKDKYNGFFIEAGAADGNIESSTYLLEKEFGWKGLLVEPNTKSFKVLTNHRQSDCINKALYDKDGIIKFLSAKNLYYSGIVETISEWHKDECYKDGYIETNMECVTLNTLLEEYNCPKHIELITLDTEGSEHKILSTFPFEKYVVDVFTIELSNQTSRDILIKNGYRQVFNEFNTKALWETYYFHKDFHIK
jgi:FkbM family methyltransferase